MAEHGERLMVNLNETCWRMGLSKPTVLRLIREGQLPVVRIGRAIRVPVDAIRAFVQTESK